MGKELSTGNDHQCKWVQWQAVSYKLAFPRKKITLLLNISYRN